MYKKKSLPAISLAIFASIILMLTIPFTAMTNRAYAHNFGGDESAEFLAKVQELKVETHLIQQNIGNLEIIAWHIDKTGEFWNANDTNEMAERNQRLSKEIPDGLSALFEAANSTNPDAAKVKQIVDGLDDSLAEAIIARINQSARNNATVGALAITDVLDETLENYGDATGADFDLNDMSNMESMNGTGSGDNMSSSSGDNMTMSSGGSMSMDSTNIENMAAYQASQGLAAAAQSMFNDLKAKAPSNMTSVISKSDQGFTDLKKAIDSKASPIDVMTIVHTEIHPNLQTAFNLQVAPEFPLPLMIMMPALAAVIIAGRKLRFGRN